MCRIAGISGSDQIIVLSGAALLMQSAVSVQPVSCYNRDHQAYTVLLIAGWFYVSGYTLGAENRKLNSGTVNFWRGFSTTLFNFIIVRCSGKKLDFKDLQQFSYLNWRSFYCAIHGIVLSVSLYYLSPPIVHTINASGPVIVFAMDYFRNAAFVTQRQLYGIFIGIIGLTTTINSQMFLKWMGYEQDHPSRFHYVDAGLQIKTLVSLILFLCQIGWGYALIITKQIKYQDAYQIGFHFGVFQLLMGIMTGFVLGIPEFSFVETLEVMLKVSLPLGIANVLLTLSLTMTRKTGNLTMVTFNNVITGYLVSIFRYDEEPNWLAITGSLCIFIGLFFVIIK